MRQLPDLGVFPGNVNRVVEVQQQSFAAIKKTQTKKIVVDETSASGRTAMLMTLNPVRPSATAISAPSEE